MEGYTISEYVAQLKRLSIYSDLNAFLDEKFGMCYKTPVQKRLLSEKDLTFKKAMGISLAMQATEPDRYRGCEQTVCEEYTFQKK